MKFLEKTGVNFHGFGFLGYLKHKQKKKKADGILSKLNFCA